MVMFLFSSQVSERNSGLRHTTLAKSETQQSLGAEQFECILEG